MIVDANRLFDEMMETETKQLQKISMKNPEEWKIEGILQFFIFKDCFKTKFSVV
jgi:hypothetical protein